MDISTIPTKDLEKELKKRTDKTPVWCTGCNAKWPAIMSGYTGYPERLHCVGCMLPMERCTCR